MFMVRPHFYSFAAAHSVAYSYFYQSVLWFSTWGPNIYMGEKWENMKLILRKTWHNGMHLPSYKILWWDFVHTIINLQDPQKQGTCC